MSRYATWADLVKRYPSAAKASANEDMDEAYISSAEDEVDLRLSSVTTTPFTGTIPGIIKSLTIDVAFFKLTIRTKESKAIGEYLYGRDGNGGLFGAILAGKVKIGSSTPNSAWIDKEYHTRFGPDDPIHWHPDIDSIVDADDDRGP